VQRRLDEAEETLRAIRSGEVDAVVVSGPRGDQVYTLKNADEPYRRLVESMSEGAVTVSPEGFILYSNSQFANLLRLPLPRLLGSSITDHVQSGERAAVGEILADAQRTPRRLELRLLAGDGNEIPVLVSVSSVEVDDVRKICLVATDLSEQKRNQDIVASERLAQLILKHAAQAIIVIDSNGEIIRASDEARKLAGRSILQEPFDAAFSMERRIPGSQKLAPFVQQELLRAASQGQILRDEEVRLTQKDGNYLELLVSMGPLWGATNEFHGCVVTMTDITERYRSAQAAKEAVAARALAAGLIKGQEEERRRLARDLHDGLNQKVAALLLRIGLMERKVETAISEELRTMETWAIEVSEEIRRVSHELHPATLENLGLVHSLEGLCSEFRSEFSSHHVPASLPPEIGICLYRVTQEVLRNAAKHTKADVARVALSGGPAELHLLISDLPRGMDPLEKTRGGQGITSLEERVGLLGGSLSIEKGNSGGLAIHVRLPYGPEESIAAR
jgi:PAS domain S-box-containing protein